MPQQASSSIRQANVMIYGDNTTGKSVCATTAPKPIYFMDLDNRPQTYMGVPELEFDVFKNEKGRATAYRDFSSRLRELQNKGDDLPYATVVVDSTTSLVDAMTDEILGLGGKGSGAHEGLDLKHWGTIAERYRKLFGILRDLPCLTVVISHEQIFKDEVTGSIVYATMAVGKKISKKAPGYFDEIYRAFTEKNRRTGERSYLLQTQRDRRYPARTSYNLRDEDGSFVPILNAEEPQNLTKILEKVEKALENPEEALRRIKRERESD